MLRPTHARFADFIDKPEQIDKCWLWNGSLTNKGYGQFNAGKRKTVTAHRFSYELFVAPIPTGSCVLHRCDTPACVNPKHLFLGTQADNVCDMVSKKRQCRGVKQGLVKLNEMQVRLIKFQLKLNDVSSGIIASWFNVTEGAVHQIKIGKNWKHVV